MAEAEAVATGAGKDEVTFGDSIDQVNHIPGWQRPNQSHPGLRRPSQSYEGMAVNEAVTSGVGRGRGSYNRG